MAAAFDLDHQRALAYDVLTNLLPRNAASGAVNHASDTGNNAAKRTNRGFEGRAISSDGRDESVGSMPSPR